MPTKFENLNIINDNHLNISCDNSVKNIPVTMFDTIPKTQDHFLYGSSTNNCSIASCDEILNNPNHLSPDISITEGKNHSTTPCEMLQKDNLMQKSLTKYVNENLSVIACDAMPESQHCLIPQLLSTTTKKKLPITQHDCMLQKAGLWKLRNSEFINRMVSLSVREGVGLDIFAANAKLEHLILPHYDAVILCHEDDFDEVCNLRNLLIDKIKLFENVKLQIIIQSESVGKYGSANCSPLRWIEEASQRSTLWFMFFSDQFVKCYINNAVKDDLIMESIMEEKNRYRIIPITPKQNYKNGVGKRPFGFNSIQGISCQRLDDHLDREIKKITELFRTRIQYRLDRENDQYNLLEKKMKELKLSDLSFSDLNDDKEQPTLVGKPSSPPPQINYTFNVGTINNLSIDCASKADCAAKVDRAAKADCAAKVDRAAKVDCASENDELNLSDLPPQTNAF